VVDAGWQEGQAQNAKAHARDVEAPVTTSRQKSRRIRRTNITPRACIMYTARSTMTRRERARAVSAAGCFDSAIFYPPPPPSRYPSHFVPFLLPGSFFPSFSLFSLFIRPTDVGMR